MKRSSSAASGPAAPPSCLSKGSPVIGSAEPAAEEGAWGVQILGSGLDAGLMALIHFPVVLWPVMFRTVKSARACQHAAAGWAVGASRLGDDRSPTHRAKPTTHRSLRAWPGGGGGGVHSWTGNSLIGYGRSSGNYCDGGARSSKRNKSCDFVSSINFLITRS